ncbi:MAG: hypothetical protein P8178_10360 [Candidatus Thiodiazotropha sp.]
MKEAPESKHGQTFLGGLNHVYHCNHYNAHLQMSVMLAEGIEGFDPRDLLRDSATRLVQLLKQRGYGQQDLLDEFTWCGFGHIKPLDDDRIEMPASHYGQSSYLLGSPEKSCYFSAGFLQGVYGRVATETQCRHTHDAVDRFSLDGLPAMENPLLNPPPFTDVPARFDFPGCEAGPTPLDEAAIQAAVATLPLFGAPPEAGGDGLIPAFGVVLTNHYADYYNIISYETYHRMLEVGVPADMAREAFVQCGHVCAFHTFGGILESPEFHALVVPQCKTVEDWIHGMLAVVNALGWGTWRVEKIVPGESLTIRIYNSYEGIGYRRLYPTASEKALSFLAMGGVRGLAHLFWKIDIRERPGLSQDFYLNVFNSQEGYWNVEQTHAIAAGDAYDRIVAWK